MRDRVPKLPNWRLFRPVADVSLPARSIMPAFARAVDPENVAPALGGSRGRGAVVYSGGTSTRKDYQSEEDVEPILTCRSVIRSDSIG